MNWVSPSGLPRAQLLTMADVAYSQDSVPFRDVAGAEFRFGKLVTLPFFGAGVVEIPPGGYKHEKNARAMHLCFFVHKGKVDVAVAGTRFSVGPGGAFQVPRGTSPALPASPFRVPFLNSIALDAASSI